MSVALAAALALASIVWLTRYQYVGQGSTVMRVNRWTGTAVVLVRGRWRLVVGVTSPERLGSPLVDTVALLKRMSRIADSLALDSARRVRDADPYADITGLRYSPDNRFAPHSADGYDSILHGHVSR